MYVRSNVNDKEVVGIFISDTGEEMVYHTVGDNGLVERRTLQSNIIGYEIIDEDTYLSYSNKKVSNTNNNKSVSKFQTCVDLYKEMMNNLNGDHPIRKDAIQKFMSTLDISDSCAATYHQSIRSKIKSGEL